MDRRGTELVAWAMAVLVMRAAVCLQGSSCDLLDCPSDSVFTYLPPANTGDTSGARHPPRVTAGRVSRALHVHPQR
jgi:hypothetical protein